MLLLKASDEGWVADAVLHCSSNSNWRAAAVHVQLPPPWHLYPPRRDAFCSQHASHSLRRLPRSAKAISRHPTAAVTAFIATCTAHAAAGGLIALSAAAVGPQHGFGAAAGAVGAAGAGGWAGNLPADVLQAAGAGWRHSAGAGAAAAGSGGGWQLGCLPLAGRHALAQHTALVRSRRRQCATQPHHCPGAAAAGGGAARRPHARPAAPAACAAAAAGGRSGGGSAARQRLRRGAVCGNAVWRCACRKLSRHTGSSW